MAKQDDSGDKTENATPKRLRDARKRGDVAKSRDVTNTLGLAFTLALFALVMGNGIERLAALTLDALASPGQDFATALGEIGGTALEAFLVLSAIVLLPIAAFGLLVEFLQSGPIFALEKVKPDLENVNPTAGVKRMFSLDNFVEVIKSIAKTAILFAIVWFVVGTLLDELMWLPVNGAGALVDATGELLLRLLGWTLGIFLLITALDAAYQQHSYAKKMRMSLRDIRQEHKDSEGDPQVKGQRREMHREFAEESASEAARSSTVLVVNPTHVAVAILYDRETQPVPMISAMAEAPLAGTMRRAAAEAHVPVLRNERLARTLLADVEEGDLIPPGLFDVVAEVILWATRTREAIARDLGDAPLWEESEPADAPPGEDLTEYPPESRVSGAAASEAAAAAERAAHGRDEEPSFPTAPPRPLHDVRESRPETGE